MKTELFVGFAVRYRNRPEYKGLDAYLHAMDLEGHFVEFGDFANATIVARSNAEELAKQHSFKDDAHLPADIVPVYEETVRIVRESEEPTTEEFWDSLSAGDNIKGLERLHLPNG